MTNAHLFILVVFGTLLALNCLNYRRTMRRYDREDAEIRRLAASIRKRKL